MRVSPAHQAADFCIYIMQSINDPLLWRSDRWTQSFTFGVTCTVCGQGSVFHGGSIGDLWPHDGTGVVLVE